MFKEKVPRRLRYETVIVMDSSACRYPGRAATKKWTSREAFWRGFRQSAKIVGVLVGVTLPFAILEPFAFMVWGSFVLGSVVFVLGPFLHMNYWAEAVSFFFVEAECPYCHVKGKLVPYVSTAFEEKFTVLCPACGQTCTAHSED